MAIRSGGALLLLPCLAARGPVQVVSAATATAIATPSPLPPTCCSHESRRCCCCYCCWHLASRAGVFCADRRPQTADRSPCPPVLPFARLPPLHRPLPTPARLSTQRCRYPLCRKTSSSASVGIHYTVLAVAVAAAIRHTPSATTLGPVRGKRCRTGRPKIPTALGVNPLSATISSSHPTFLDLVDLEVTFPGRVVAIIASLYRRRR